MAKRVNRPGSADIPPPDESISVCRRLFLQGLSALGASIVLPGPIEKASASSIDAAWDKLVAEPWYFEISEFGAIVEPGVPEPEVRSDVFDVWHSQSGNPEDLISAIEELYPLISAFQYLAEVRCEELESEIRRLDPGSQQRVNCERLLAEISDADCGWQVMIRHDGTAGIDQHWDFIQHWLDEPIDWSESDWFPSDWDGYGRAFRFFQDMDRDVLDALDIAIVEGDRPGSDYIAAELRQPIAAANAAAAQLGLPFRFRPEGGGPQGNVTPVS